MVPQTRSKSCECVNTHLLVIFRRLPHRKKTIQTFFSSYRSLQKKVTHLAKKVRFAFYSTNRSVIDASCQGESVINVVIQKIVLLRYVPIRVNRRGVDCVGW